MVKEARETNRFKRITLLDTNYVFIQYVICKQNKAYDRIRVVRYGTRYTEPQEIVVFRYEDENYINEMLKTFNYKG